MLGVKGRSRYFVPPDPAERQPGVFFCLALAFLFSVWFTTPMSEELSGIGEAFDDRTERGLIYRMIPAIMGKLKAVGRDQKNRTQNFSYRGIDDLYNALSPIMAEFGVFTVPTVLEERSEERKSKSGSVMLHVVLKVRYRFFASDGSFFDAVLIGEGMDSGDKASNKAESIAHKYALTQVFAVKTEDQSDPDGETPEELEPKATTRTQPEPSRPTSTVSKPPPAAPSTKPVDSLKETLGQPGVAKLLAMGEKLGVGYSDFATIAGQMFDRIDLAGLTGEQANAVYEFAKKSRAKE